MVQPPVQGRDEVVGEMGGAERGWSTRPACASSVRCRAASTSERKWSSSADTWRNNHGPRLFVEFNHASGDDDPTDGRRGVRAGCAGASSEVPHHRQLLPCRSSIQPGRGRVPEQLRDGPQRSGRRRSDQLGLPGMVGQGQAAPLFAAPERGVADERAAARVRHRNAMADDAVRRLTAHPDRHAEWMPEVCRPVAGAGTRQDLRRCARGPRG